MGRFLHHQIIAHPVLFAAYPTVFLYAQNSHHFDVAVIIRPLLFCLGATGAAWWLLAWFTRDHSKAALPLSVVLVGLFSFRAFHDLIVSKGYGGASDSLLAIDTLMFGLPTAAAVGVAFVFGRLSGPGRWNYIFNVVATSLMTLPLFHLAGQTYKTNQAANAVLQHQRSFPLPELRGPGPGHPRKPDIYLIVLDAYGRQDILKRYYGYDNSAFVESLQDHGFFVASASETNYTSTAISLAATLNFTYLSEMIGTEIHWSKDWRFARDLIRHNRASDFLSRQGYSIVAISTPYYNVDLSTAGVYLGRWWFLSDFENSLVNMTPIPWLLRKCGLEVVYALHRKKNLFTLDRLPEVVALDGPKFVYAHILSPHPPFVFGPGGEAVNPKRRYSWSDGYEFQMQEDSTQQEYVKGYRDQIAFVSNKVRDVVDRILAASKSDPVILIQSDHGPASADWIFVPGHPSIEERIGVLNALFLGPCGPVDLYDRISPINTFRVVFNACFDAGLPLLEDRSYYISNNHPYEFVPYNGDKTVTATRHDGLEGSGPAKGRD